MMFPVFVRAPKGLEYLLEEELKNQGLQISRVSPQGVYGEGSLRIIYQICLWSRLANRVELILLSGSAHDKDSIYALCNAYPWEQVFSVDKTLNIAFHGTSDAIRNTMFGAQVIKDAIADHFRALKDTRPIIDRTHPDVRLHAHLKQDTLTVSFDLTGYSMHQRGYRTEAGAAPLKENIAAALLLRAKWPELARHGASCHDPMCGSGTLVIEAAMISGNRAPGLLREDQALQHWLPHQPILWQEVREEATLAAGAPKERLFGTDCDPHVIRQARANAERAGVSDWVDFAVHDLEAGKPNGLQNSPTGLLITNPPYGERLDDVPQLVPVYQKLGQVLSEQYQGWQAAILTSSPLLAKATGLRASKQYTIYNGTLACKLYCMAPLDDNQLRQTMRPETLSENARMFANRLRKNATHLKKWAARNGVSCYRLYDADLPEYAFAIDCYRDHIVLQEYVAPASIDPAIAAKRSLEVVRVVPYALEIAPDRVILKQRKPQRGSDQYQKIDHTRDRIAITEGRAQLLVNLQDYLDTGLFLDHRLLRLQFGNLKPLTRFLNCFCYTATASVHAALAGALTTNVDLSNTYLAWGQDNFRLNHLDISRHQFIQYDCLTWLATTHDQFDIIFLDPPSFSNSKRMLETLDIQRDHVTLIQKAMRLLSPDGCLYFSTNFRQFKLDPVLETTYAVPATFGC